MTRRVLLFDGDVVAYRAAAVVEKMICFDGDNCFPVGSLSEAKANVTDQMERAKERLEADDYVVAISDTHYFRQDIFPKYKTNRSGKPKPTVLSFLKEWMEEEFTSFKRPKLEADDILGILSTSKKIIKADERVIVSIDKDMKTIPGLFFNLQTPEFGVELISEEEAAYWHMYQTLIGDTTDCYPGCPGVGPKTAEKLLDGLTSYEEMWPVVLKQFEKKKLSGDEALTQARVARICQVSDYNFKTKKVKLWQPPM